MKTSHTGSESETPAVALRQRAEAIAQGEAFRVSFLVKSITG